MPRELSYESKIKQNRGKIDLKNPDKYKPWILARECFKGDGTRHQIPDLYYHNRTIHLMSDLEKDVYYTLRSNENVVEMFEQFPLMPISKTEELCEEYGIMHPKHPITKKNILMTSDFLLIIKDKSGEKRWIACAVKMSSDLEDIRTRENLHIEKEYWNAMGVMSYVITEKQINKDYVNNIILCRQGFTGIGSNSMYDAIKYLIVNKIINIDMNRPIDLDHLVYKAQKGELMYGKNLYNEKRYIDNRFNIMACFS